MRCHWTLAHAVPFKAHSRSTQAPNKDHFRLAKIACFRPLLYVQLVYILAVRVFNYLYIAIMPNAENLKESADAKYETL